MSLQQLERRLDDGSRALIRPIRPGDKDRLQRGLARMSSESRYMRFHAPMPSFSDEQLRYLTEIDYHDHMAWVALDADHLEDPGMGVARYIRLAGEPEVAEAAVAVVDQYQGRGLGGVLLQVLAEYAMANGIRTFRSYVLDENTPMLAVFERLGGRISPEEDGVWCVDLDLPIRTGDAAGTDDLGGSLVRRLLREAASGRLSFVGRRASHEPKE